MEESTTGVEPHPQKPTENSPAISSSQVQPSTFTKVDNNLTGIGFFTASSKRSRKAVEKTTVVFDQGVEHRISILPSAKYGLPITQDQDFWLALMQLVEDRRRQEGKLTNPFTFTTAELTKILGQAHSGKNYKAVQEWLSVMAFTGIEGGAYNVAKKQWFTKRTHAVDSVVSTGKELPDGAIADKNHIWFSPWQLDNINAGNLIAIELTTYTQLENNISKNLVPHLQEWLYASQRDGRFEKQYEDVCQLLGIRVYRYLSDIQRKLGPSLDELTKHGYLSKWAIESMANRKNYKIVLWHGRKYHSDRQARLEKKSQIENQSAGESAPQSKDRRQRRLNLAPVPAPEPQPPVIIDYVVVGELEKRGIGGSDARKLLASLQPGQPILDQLEYGDVQIELAKGKITNPPGFYISLLQRNIPIPSTFETSRTKKAREEAEFLQRQALLDQQQTALVLEEAERQRLEAPIAALSQEDRQTLFAEAKAALLKERPQMADFFRLHPESAVEDAAVKKRMRELIAEGWKPHYDINPEIRQATRLQAGPTGTVPPNPAQPILAQADAASGQGSDPRHPVATSQQSVVAEKLRAILTTLQLPAPVEETTVGRSPAAESRPASTSETDPVW